LIKPGSPVGAFTKTYTLSSRGWRTLVTVTGDDYQKLNGTQKRYDADNRAAWYNRAGWYHPFTNWPGTDWGPQSETSFYLSFRYDPAGNQVLSLDAQITEIWNTPGNNFADQDGASVNRNLYHTISVDGQVQSIGQSTGAVGRVACYVDLWTGACDLSTSDYRYYRFAAWQDPTFGVAEGVTSGAWEIMKPLSVLPPTAGGAPLEAPTTPLSTTVRVDPLAVTAPGSSVPSAADPTTVTAPPTPSTMQNQQSTSSSTVFSSNTSLTAGTDVSSPSFGVQSYNLFNPNQPSQTPSSTQSQPSTPSTTVSSSNFNSSMALEAPVSVLPPAIINLNTNAVSQPSSVIPSVDPTTITAPGSSVPGVGPNPSSNPGGVTPPTASNPNQPVVPPVNGPVTGVKPPTGSSEPTVTPKFLYEASDGTICDSEVSMTSPFDPCGTPKDIRDYEKKMELERQGKSGDINAKIELAKQDVALLAGRMCKDKKTECVDYVNRLGASDYYESLDPARRLHLWQITKGGLMSGDIGKKDLQDMVRLAERCKVVNRTMICGSPSGQQKRYADCCSSVGAGGSPFCVCCGCLAGEFWAAYVPASYFA
jgi:hypothetical protein